MTKAVKKKRGNVSDRIGVTFGRKLSDGNYGSISINITYESNVEPEETVEEAKERVMEFTKESLVKEIESITHEME